MLARMFSGALLSRRDVKVGGNRVRIAWCFAMSNAESMLRYYCRGARSSC